MVECWEACKGVAVDVDDWRYRSATGRIRYCPRIAVVPRGYLIAVLVETAVIVSEDSETRTIREDVGGHRCPRSDDLLVPQCVEERFVLLDRTTKSDVVGVKVSPWWLDAGNP